MHLTKSPARPSVPPVKSLTQLSARASLDAISSCDTHKIGAPVQGDTVWLPRDCLEKIAGEARVFGVLVNFETSRYEYDGFFSTREKAEERAFFLSSTEFENDFERYLADPTEENRVEALSTSLIVECFLSPMHQMKTVYVYFDCHVTNMDLDPCREVHDVDCGNRKMSSMSAKAISEQIVRIGPPVHVIKELKRLAEKYGTKLSFALPGHFSPHKSLPESQSLYTPEIYSNQGLVEIIANGSMIQNIAEKVAATNFPPQTVYRLCFVLKTCLVFFVLSDNDQAGCFHEGALDSLFGRVTVKLSKYKDVHYHHTSQEKEQIVDVIVL